MIIIIYIHLGKINKRIVLAVNNKQIVSSFPTVNYRLAKNGLNSVCLTVIGVSI